MKSRRLVVWISAGILGFQGATFAFVLLKCTVLTWLFVRQHGLGLVRPDAAVAGLRGAAIALAREAAYLNHPRIRLHLAGESVDVPHLMAPEAVGGDHRHHPAPQRIW